MAHDAQGSLREMMSDLPPAPQAHAFVGECKSLPAGVDAPNLVAKVRDTCGAVVGRCAHVCAVDAVEELPVGRKEVVDSFLGAMLLHPPLRFGDDAAKVNFWCLVELLGFGQAHEAKLEQLCGSGLREVVLRGCIGLFLQHANLDAKMLRSMDPVAVSTAFSVPLTVDDTVGGAIKVSKPSPLKPLVEQWAHAMFETGAILFRLGCDDFAAFLKRQCEAVGDAPHSKASRLCFALATTFPTFSDSAVVRFSAGGDAASGGGGGGGGRPLGVVFSAKALALVATLAHRLGPSVPWLAMDPAELADLPCAASLRIAGVLLKAGGIRGNAPRGTRSAKELQGRRDVNAGGEVECSLRAAAVVACDAIAAGLNAQQDGEQQPAKLSGFMVGWWLQREGAAKLCAPDTPLPVCPASVHY